MKNLRHIQEHRIHPFHKVHRLPGFLKPLAFWYVGKMFYEKMVASNVQEELIRAVVGYKTTMLTRKSVIENVQLLPFAFP